MGASIPTYLLLPLIGEDERTEVLIAITVLEDEIGFVVIQVTVILLDKLARR